MIPRRAAVALLLVTLAPPAAGEKAGASPIGKFIDYAAAWCALGDETRCTIAGELAPMPDALDDAAERCTRGDEDGCRTAWSIRESFWVHFGRLSVQPDMLPGPDGAPPARPIWEQPDPGPWTPAPCDAFIPECGYFGDPANPGGPGG